MRSILAVALNHHVSKLRAVIGHFTNWYIHILQSVSSLLFTEFSSLFFQFCKVKGIWACLVRINVPVKLHIDTYRRRLLDSKELLQKLKNIDGHTKILDIYGFYNQTLILRTVTQIYYVILCIQEALHWFCFIYYQRITWGSTNMNCFVQGVQAVGFWTSQMACHISLMKRYTLSTRFRADFNGVTECH